MSVHFGDQKARFGCPDRKTGYVSPPSACKSILRRRLPGRTSGVDFDASHCIRFRKRILSGLRTGYVHRRSPSRSRGLLLKRRGASDHVEGLGLAPLGLNPVLGDGRQVVEKGSEAVHRRFDPLEGCGLHRLEAPPRAAGSNHLGLVQPDDGLREGVYRVRPDAPTCGASRPNSRPSTTPRRSPPIAFRAHLGDPGPTRTARSRSSGEYLFEWFMAPVPQGGEPPGNPVRFSWRARRDSNPRHPGSKPGTLSN